MRFLIVIPTFNRPDLLVEAVESILAQDHSDWRIIVSDNRSTVPASIVLEKHLRDPRISVVLQPEHVSGTEHGHRICLHIIPGQEFDYVNFMADDDYMVPGALSVLAALQDPAPIIAGNVGYFYQRTGDVTITESRFSGKVAPINLRVAAKTNASLTGIYIPEGGIGTPWDVPDNHISFIFMRKSLIDKLNETFGSFLVRPFGDVGVGRSACFAQTGQFVLRPIGVIRFFTNYGATQNQDRRALLTHHEAVFEKSPLKHVSFINCAAESYLRLLADVGIEGARLGPKIYLKHFREILRDKPKDADTVRAMLQLAVTMIRQGDILQTIAFSLRYFLAQERRPGQITLARHCPNIKTAADALLQAPSV